MKTVEVKLELTFEDSISDDNEIREIMENVAAAIVNEVNTAGIAPESSETFTTTVVVKNIYNTDVVVKNLTNFITS